MKIMYLIFLVMNIVLAITLKNQLYLTVHIVQECLAKKNQEVYSSPSVNTAPVSIFVEQMTKYIFEINKNVERLQQNEADLHQLAMDYSGLKSNIIAPKELATGLLLL